ncbi:MAG: hypothetical protein ACHP7N_08400 [Caulobacterales bacterium]
MLAICGLIALVGVNLAITLSMVIARPESQVAQLAGAYRLANLLVALLALWIAIRRKWLGLLLVFALAQLAAFWLFAEYVLDRAPR